MSRERQTVSKNNRADAQGAPTSRRASAPLAAARQASASPVRNLDARRSRAAIKGHPLHPLLIPFPLVLLILLPIVDIAFAVTSDGLWQRLSTYLLMGGLATGGLAALVGLVDFFAIRIARRRRAGWLHLLASGAAVGLAAVNVLLRTGSQRLSVVPAGLILSLVTAGLLVAASWYGGELPYRHGVGLRQSE